MHFQLIFVQAVSAVIILYARDSARELPQHIVVKFRPCAADLKKV